VDKDLLVSRFPADIGGSGKHSPHGRDSCLCAVQAMQNFVPNVSLVEHCLTLLPVCVFSATPQRTSVVSAAAFSVEAKQNSLKRQRTTEKARLYNKSRKSEITTRMKKVLSALESFKTTPPASEAELAPVAGLLNEAYACIDKAVVKGVMHRNTAARRKARLAKARRTVLINAGLYTPAQ
jgi:small subunit ribosomal protein S20